METGTNSIEENPNKVSYNALTNGLEGLKFVIIDTQVILRLLEICRKYNIHDNQLVVRFAKHALAPSSNIDHGFVDNFEESVKETIEEEEEERLRNRNDKQTKTKVIIM